MNLRKDSLAEDFSCLVQSTLRSNLTERAVFNHGVLQAIGGVPVESPNLPEGTRFTGLVNSYDGSILLRSLSGRSTFNTVDMGDYAQDVLEKYTGAQARGFWEKVAEGKVVQHRIQLEQEPYEVGTASFPFPDVHLSVVTPSRWELFITKHTNTILEWPNMILSMYTFSKMPEIALLAFRTYLKGCEELGVEPFSDIDASHATYKLGGQQRIGVVFNPQTLEARTETKYR